MNYLGMIHPLIPLYAEEAWYYVPEFMKKEPEFYKIGYFELPKSWQREDLANDMRALGPLKEAVLKLLEQARQKSYLQSHECDLSRLLGNSLQADLFIVASPQSSLHSFLSSYSEHLKRDMLM